MKTPFSESAVDAQHAPDRHVGSRLYNTLSARSVTLAVPVLLAALLAGCGSGGSSDPLSTDSESTVAVDNPAPLPGGPGGPGGPAEPQQPEASQNDPVTDTPVTALTTPGADVLLIEPAGRPELPTAQEPSLKFSSFATASTSGRVVSRSAASGLASSDGGRSTASTVSANVTVSWDPPIQNADGSSISDLAGYRVYQGNESQLAIVQEMNETGSGQRRLTQVPNVSAANSCFAVTAFDTSANESALGDVVCKDIIDSSPPTNSLAPALSSVTQLASNDGQADIQLVWQPPSASNAGAGATIDFYSLFHGSQSQLFKIQELSEADTRNGSNRLHVVSGIGGAQACFALTARYTDGTETSLGEIVCVALTHSAPAQPGDQLRPFNVGVDLTGTSTARVSWDRPNTVVSSADATGIEQYDLFQGSRSQVFKIAEISESGAAGTRRSTNVENVFDGSNCFALTATDTSRRHSALSTIVCANMPSAGGGATPPASGSLGVTSLTAQETSAGSVALSWDTPQLVAVGQPISNLTGYNVYQGSETQLFKVAERPHNQAAQRQQFERTGVDSNNACFAITAYDSNRNEAPLSEIVCANVSGSASVPQVGVVPPTELTTSALGGSTTITLTWLASGAAASGTADPNVDSYNIYQGNHDRLYKVREVEEAHDADPRTTTTFTGVPADSACFALTAQYHDLRESRLSDIVCRDD